MNFGFQLEEGGALRLYLHSAQQGRKLDLLRRAEKVSFEMDGGHRLLEGRGACDFSYAYACLMGQARPVFLEDLEEKRRGLAWHPALPDRTGRSGDPGRRGGKDPGAAPGRALLDGQGKPAARKRGAAG